MVAIASTVRGGRTQVGGIGVDDKRIGPARVSHPPRSRPMTAIGPGVAEGGLSSLLKRGAVMAAMSLVICQVAVIVQTIVLGRLLGPEEVGLFVAGSVAMDLLMGRLLRAIRSVGSFR
jgi:hypothetical protein